MKVARRLHYLLETCIELHKKSTERPGLLYTESTLNDFTVRAVMALQVVGVTREQMLEAWDEAAKL